MGDTKDDYDYLFKVALIGDSGSGKSCILSRYTRNIFDHNSKSTIGVEFATKTETIPYDDGTHTVKIQVWDTAGQERFRAITNAYYRGAVGIIIVYDITKYQSFKNVEMWLKEVRDHLSSDAFIVLVGNKADLSHVRAVDKTEAASFAKEHGLLFHEVSALKEAGGNVQEMLRDLAINIHQKINKTFLDNPDVITTNNVVVTHNPNPQPGPIQTGGCC